MTQEHNCMYMQGVSKLDPQQREVYNAVVDEINASVKYRSISFVQALIEILIKRDILNHQQFFEIDDEILSTMEVRELHKQLLGPKRLPTRKTILNRAQSFSLGTKCGGEFKHSKRKWTRFINTSAHFKRKV